MGQGSENNKRNKELISNAPPGTVDYKTQKIIYDPTNTNNNNNQHITIIDKLASPAGMFTWYKPNTSPKEDLPMTGYELWMKFLTYMKTRMEMKPTRIIVTVDDRWWTPVEKFPTQEDRQSSTKIKIEPLKLSQEQEDNVDSQLFYDGGIVHPDHSSQDGSGNYIPTPIRPSLLRGSSHLRKVLTRFFIKRFIQWISENTLFMLHNSIQGIDFDFHGRTYTSLDLDHNHHTLAIKQKELPQGHILYGESDAKIVQWADYYMDQYHIQIETIDTDIVTWACKLYHRHKEAGFQSRIHWITIDRSNGPTKGKVVITELCSYIDYLIKAHGFKHYRQLSVWCGFCGGTDYNDKKWLTNYFNVIDINKSIKSQEVHHALLRIRHDSLLLLASNKTNERVNQYKEEQKHAIALVHAIINNLSYNNANQKKYKPTDPKKIAFIAKRLWWHLGYIEMHQGMAMKILLDREQLRARERDREDEKKQPPSSSLSQKQSLMAIDPIGIVIPTLVSII